MDTAKKFDATRNEREKNVRDALAILSLDGGPVSDFCNELLQQYIDGEIDVDEMDIAINEKYGVIKNERSISL